MKNPTRNQQGFALIWTLVFLGTFLAILLSINTFALDSAATNRTKMLAFNALSVAEAGADRFMYEINADNSYAGTNGSYGSTNTCSAPASPVTLFNTTQQGKGTYDTCVQPGTITNEKIVISTGKIYFPATASTPKVTRKVKLVIKGTAATGYTVQTGPGGLTLSNNVVITTGPVYVGGKLIMSNNSSIGTVSSPQSVYVTDTACPYPATASFPTLCGNGQGNPGYSIDNSNGTFIRGSVYAPNTIKNPGNFTNPGFVSSTVPTVTLPAEDHNSDVASITNAQDPGDADCPAHSNTVTWNAGTKWTGNVSIGNGCVVTVKGDVWITGNLTFGNNASIQTYTGLTSMPKIIIDGSSGLTTGNNSSFIPNSGGIGFKVVTFYSRNAANTGANSCSPSCSNVTGSELANSSNWTTINLGNGFAGANGSIFYSRWTKTIVSNNATIGALIGQNILLSNNGNLIFNSTVSTGSYTWDVHYYEQIF